MPNKKDRAIDVGKYDKNMQADAQEADELQWYTPSDSPLRLQGFPWYADDRIYRRMPLNPPAPLPEAVDNLAWHTSGGQVHFRTNSKQVHVKVKLRGAFNMVHMPQTGTGGCDLYVGPPGNKTYYHTTKFPINDTQYQLCLFDHTEKAIRDFTLNMPLYNGVDELSIGLEPECTIEAPLPYDDEKPIIIYGTSITHGGCASRPGMAYPNIISRKINRPMINLGFSGSGRAEPEVAQAIGSIPDPGLLVIDCEANCSADGYYEEMLPPFISILREARPEAPILLVSRIPNITETLQPVPREKRLKRVAWQQELIASLVKAGDQNIYFQDGSDILGPDGHEGTVDTTHPTDFGFWHMADKLTPVFNSILQG